MLKRLARALRRRVVGRPAAAEEACEAYRAPAQPVSDAQARLLRKLLLENLLPFWSSRIVDVGHGGYRLGYDVAGAAKDQPSKTIVDQARTCWFFSKLSTTPFAGDAHKGIAEHGYQFLRDRLWDAEQGGFFWAVDAKAGTPTDDRKHLYGQAFGLYALSTYAAAFGDSDAAALAGKCFEVFDNRAHDGHFGGYRECFTRDWRPSEPGTRGPVGALAGLKLMNTHLHLMEALSTMVTIDAATSTRVRQRLVELLLIQSSGVLRKSVGGCTDRHAVDWTPMVGGEASRGSYGHDLENIWLLMHACEAAGVSSHPLLDQFITTADYAIRYGFDDRDGGFFESGLPGARADRRNKLWWVQAESMTAMLALYRLTGFDRYRSCFVATLDWIDRKQADWSAGEWHAEVRPDGSVHGDKGGPWKTPYHSGRALLQCLEWSQMRAKSLSQLEPSQMHA